MKLRTAEGDLGCSRLGGNNFGHSRVKEMARDDMGPMIDERQPDSELVASLARLWPHREHESNAVKGLFCLAGLHRWRQLDLSELYPDKEVRYCFWCSKIKIDGVIHQP